MKWNVSFVSSRSAAFFASPVTRSDLLSAITSARPASSIMPAIRASCSAGPMLGVDHEHHDVGALDLADRHRHRDLLDVDVDPRLAADAGGVDRGCSRGRRSRTARRPDRSWCRPRGGRASAPRRAGGSSATTCRRSGGRRTRRAAGPGGSARCFDLGSSSSGGPSNSGSSLGHGAPVAPEPTALGDRLEQRVDAAAVGRGDRVRGGQPELVKIVDQVIVRRVIDLVDREEHRLAGGAQLLRELADRSPRRRRGRRRRAAIASASSIARSAWRWMPAPITSRRGLGIEAAGVDDAQRRAEVVGFAVAAIARQVRRVVDERGAAADEPVEQRRLADVRSADDRRRAASSRLRSAVAELRELELLVAAPLFDDLDEQRQVHGLAERLGERGARGDPELADPAARPCRRRSASATRARRRSPRRSRARPCARSRSRPAPPRRTAAPCRAGDRAARG